MSEQNLEIVRRVFEDFEAGLEREDPVAFFDSEAVPNDYEVVLKPVDAIERRTVWRGREGFREFFENWADDFENLAVR